MIFNFIIDSKKNVKNRKILSGKWNLAKIISFAEFVPVTNKISLHSFLQKVSLFLRNGLKGKLIGQKNFF